MGEDKHVVGEEILESSKLKVCCVQRNLPQFNELSRCDVDVTDDHVTRNLSR